MADFTLTEEHQSLRGVVSFLRGGGNNRIHRIKKRGRAAGPPPG
ncbi:MAG: hypothetical protein V3V62_15445 [bacterium]